MGIVGKEVQNCNIRLKKFVIGNFLNFFMVDSKLVITQVEELQKLIYELHVALRD